MGTFGGEDEAFLRVMEVATLCSVPMALKAAIQLHVMDILAHHGGGGEDEQHFLSASQIAAHFADYPASAAPPIPLSADSSDSLNRILRVLASHGLLSSSLQTPLTACGSPPALAQPKIATYALNPLSRYLLQTPGEGSLAPLVLLVQDPAFMHSLYFLHESVIDGSVPFTKVHGMPYFSFTQKDARLHHLTNNAMFGHTKLFTQALLKNYTGFKDIHTLVDVGGGVGACLSEITSKHPHIKGINFDLPHVIKAAPKYPGVEHIGGDMFIEIPKGEAIFMKWILHDWSDESCLRILENCYKALPNKGKVIIVDSILPTKVEHELGARVRYQRDLIMFANTQGGKERTEEEILNISKAIGFSGLQLICNIHGCSVVEIVKDNI